MSPYIYVGTNRTILACAGSRDRPCPEAPSCRDHPRVRGEQPIYHKLLHEPRGPSPRARGAEFRCAPGRHRRGTIPACAGSSSRRPFSGRTTEGPSPRARGAEVRKACTSLEVWTIPACAGSRSCCIPTPAPAGDHPRVRGEQPTVTHSPGTMTGPSPRARGAVRGSSVSRSGRGTIPACAGSTTGGTPRPRSARDHPRVRGEHQRRAVLAGAEDGPSPRARGARRVGAGWERAVGTIPACAGSTDDHCHYRHRGGDHPRVRGEHISRVIGQQMVLGPSPRARGAPPGGGANPGVLGTIPACAGSTVACRELRRQYGDHPRVRGEHSSAVALMVTSTGPSPRARGAPHLTDR
mgnify:CR=1 FL=1